MIHTESDELGGVGDWFDDFSQTTDDEVTDLLAHSRLASISPYSA